MLINNVSSNTIDSIGRVMKRETTYGKYKGYNIAIDNYRYKGNILQKRFVIWTDTMQKIINKYRGRNNFERIG